MHDVNFPELFDAATQDIDISDAAWRIRDIETAIMICVS